MRHSLFHGPHFSGYLQSPCPILPAQETILALKNTPEKLNLTLCQTTSSWWHIVQKMSVTHPLSTSTVSRLCSRSFPLLHGVLLFGLQWETGLLIPRLCWSPQFVPVCKYANFLTCLQPWYKRSQPIHSLLVWFAPPFHSIRVVIFHKVRWFRVDVTRSQRPVLTSVGSTWGILPKQPPHHGSPLSERISINHPSMIELHQRLSLLRVSGFPILG